MSSAYFNFSTMFFCFALFVWIENNHDDNTEPWGATLLEITSSEKHSSFPSWLCSRACWPRQRLRLPFTSSGESRCQRNMIFFCLFFCKLFITRAETHNCLGFWLIWRLFFFFFFLELLNTSSTTAVFFFTSGSPVYSCACFQQTFLPSVGHRCTDRQVVKCREVQKCATRDCDCLLVNMDVNNAGLKTFKNLCFIEKETHKLWRK